MSRQTYKKTTKTQNTTPGFPKVSNIFPNIDFGNQAVLISKVVKK